ncbi:RNA-binding protein [Candidatus Woesearchaeota archaeon]|nr:MAG: RNA-binding protein [Candidatus Woesearchaeota archaeon]
MSELIAKERDVVIPGEIIAKGMDYLPGINASRQGENIIANRTGLVEINGRVIKIIPLSGRYMPKEKDRVIGKIIDINLGGWRLDINSAYTAMLSMKEATSDFITKGADLTQYFDIGDYVITRITQVTSQKLVDVSMKGPGLGKLKNGRILSIKPNKVPRVIGKQGSMVNLIKEKTNCKIVVGQNGLVWIQGSPKDELKAVETIRMIEEKAHIPGLTDKIKEFLETNKQ